jgi:hypothetical protein
VFITSGEKTNLFDDAGESETNKKQTANLEDYTKKVEDRPEYILPKGSKKFQKIPSSLTKSSAIISVASLRHNPQSYKLWMKSFPKSLSISM